MSDHQASRRDYAGPTVTAAPAWGNVIFLGGTVGVNHWRTERAIPLLTKLGVRPELIFDPVVEDWDEAAQANEDRVKREAGYLLYYITSPQTGDSDVSAYSLVEAVMALYDDQGRAYVVFETEGMSAHVAKAIHKAESDLCERFPHAAIYDDLDIALTEIAVAITLPF